jgi:chromatin segregation and condensation protein Rec8/ScpA/Scc1 (kleisin family)
MSFTLLLEECRSRIEAIVTLLALLELLKMARLRVQQDAPFGEIWVEPAPDPGTAAEDAMTTEAPEADPPPKVRRKRERTDDDATG